MWERSPHSHQTSPRRFRWIPRKKSSSLTGRAKENTTVSLLRDSSFYSRGDSLSLNNKESRVLRKVRCSIRELLATIERRMNFLNRCFPSHNRVHTSSLRYMRKIPCFDHLNPLRPKCDSRLRSNLPHFCAVSLRNPTWQTTWILGNGRRLTQRKQRSDHGLLEQVDPMVCFVGNTVQYMGFEALIILLDDSSCVAKDCCRIEWTSKNLSMRFRAKFLFMPSTAPNAPAAFDPTKNQFVPNENVLPDNGLYRLICCRNRTSCPHARRF